MNPTPHHPANRVSRHIRALEYIYCLILQRQFSDFEGIVSFRRDSRRAYARLTRYVDGLIFHSRRGDAEARQSLQTYQVRLAEHHRRISLWTAFLCNLWLPDIAPQDPAYKTFQKIRAGIQAQSQELWNHLRTSAETHVWVDPQERAVYLDHLRLERMDRNSGAWRLSYQKLCREIYLYIRSMLAQVRYDVKGQMDRVLLEQTPPDTQFRATKAADWLKGYYPPVAAIRMWYRETAGRVWQSIQVSDQTRRNVKMMQGVLIVALGLAGGWGLQQTRLDDQIWRRIVFEVKKILLMDRNAQEKKYKSEFFQQQIAAIDTTYSPQMLRENIRHFYNHEFKDFPEAALYFSRNILKGFFVLLPDWDTEEDLKDEVIAAADVLDTQAGDILENIVALYGQKVMREGRLRNQLLDLRRVFLRYDVFLFTFIGLENDIPYLFLYSESVLKNYTVTDRAWRALGLNPSKFTRAILWPSLIWEVEGEDYPFSDKAGYFEGELAVVFRRHSDNISWTVYHEVGHVIDHLQKQFDGVPLPDNVELHAMLFPIVWARDRKDYIATRLYQEVSKADPNDKYAQAAKGILNGFVLYLGRNYPDKVRELLITNNFEQDRVKRILDHVLQVDSRALKMAAYVLFRDADQYLATAEPGSYISYVSDFKEVIYGTGHTVAQRGFFLGGGGLFGPRNGPRLLFDGDGDDSLRDGFNLRSFMNNVLGLMLYRRENWPQSTTAESIVASVLFFLLFNALALALHAMGASYRKARFYGRSLDKSVQTIYDRNPWSSGYSAGREEKERQLLTRVWAAKGNIPVQLKKDLAAFKAVASDKQRFVLDVCLCLSPLQPKRCAILNKAHDLLFFLPFLGPWLGRASWIWPVQKNFILWQKYNAAVEDLLMGVESRTRTEDLRRDLVRILEQYADNAQKQPADEQTIQAVFQGIAQEVQGLLRRPAPMVHMSIDLLRDKMTETNEPSVEFERLEVYTPGDDIRHIDWKSTARYSLSNPMVRRFSSPYGARVALWLDARGLFTDEDKGMWASDFVRSVRILHMLRGEAVLEKIILTGPDGNVVEYPVSLSAETDLVSLADRILTVGQEKFAGLFKGRLPFKMPGMIFYDAQENARFLEQLGLTDFMAGASCELRLVPLQGKRMNIFMVGAKMDQKDTIHRLAGEANRVHYW